MDISETYIKMHLALTKQLRQEPMEGDYYYNTETGDKGKLGEVYDTSKLIKLYEQDQLQEMLPKTLPSINAIPLTSKFNRYLQETCFDSFGILKIIYMNTSMEQLWLAFVMKEKFSKHWTGEEWKKE